LNNTIRSIEKTIGEESGFRPPQKPETLRGHIVFCRLSGFKQRKEKQRSQYMENSNEEKKRVKRTKGRKRTTFFRPRAVEREKWEKKDQPSTRQTVE